MKKPLLTLLCCASMTAYAAGTDSTDVNSLVVWAKNGTNVAYALEKLPQLEIGATTLSLTCGTEKVTYLFENIDRVTYATTDLSSIADVKVADKHMFVIGEREIDFPVSAEDRTLSLYDAGGKLCLSFAVRKGDAYSLPLSSLSEGMYIIKVNGSTCKVIKR